MGSPVSIYLQFRWRGKGGDDTRPPRQTDGGEELYQTREGKPKERAQITSSQTPKNTREIEFQENINIFATFSFLRLFSFVFFSYSGKPKLLSARRLETN